jgi:hypothetical protein
MVYADGEFTYLLNSGLTSKLGTYVARGNCDGYTWVFDFEVTTTGGNMNLSLWVSLILLLVSLTIFIISIISDNQYIGFLGGVGFIVSGVYTMVYGLGSLSDMCTRTISIIIIAFGFIVFFISSFYHEASDTGLGQYFGMSKPEVDRTDYFNEEFD